jgi:hypothetical protein
MWGVGVCSEVGDSGQDSGLASPFWNVTVHKPFPRRPWFMAGNIVMLIQSSSLHWSSTVESVQQVKMSLYPSAFIFPWSITRGPCPFHEKHPPCCNATSSKFYSWHYTCWYVSFSRHLPHPSLPIGLTHGIAWFITPNHTFPVVRCPVMLLFTPLRAALIVYRWKVWFMGSCSPMEPHSS